MNYLVGRKRSIEENGHHKPVLGDWRLPTCEVSKLGWDWNPQISPTLQMPCSAHLSHWQVGVDVASSSNTRGMRST